MFYCWVHCPEPGSGQSYINLRYDAGVMSRVTRQRVTPWRRWWRCRDVADTEETTAASWEPRRAQLPVDVGSWKMRYNEPAPGTAAAWHSDGVVPGTWKLRYYRSRSHGGNWTDHPLNKIYLSVKIMAANVWLVVWFQKTSWNGHLVLVHGRLALHATILHTNFFVVDLIFGFQRSLVERPICENISRIASEKCGAKQ